MEPGALQAGQSLVTQNSEKSAYPHDQLDRLADHEISQSSDNEKSENPSHQQDAVVELGQPVGKPTDEKDPKKKNGGYGYYLVGEHHLKHLKCLVLGTFLY